MRYEIYSTSVENFAAVFSWQPSNVREMLEVQYIQHSTEQNRAAEHSAAQHSAAQQRTAEQSKAQLSSAQLKTAQHS